MSAHQPLVEEWLLRAADDEANARSILKHRDGTPAGACFLSQQAAEKYLKALLLHHTHDVPKVHDVIELANLIEVHTPGIAAELKEDLILLRPFYISTRYPADIPLDAFTWLLAEQAFNAAVRTKEFVSHHLPPKK